MGGFLTMIGFWGLIVSIIWFTRTFAKKRRKRNPIIGLIGCFVLFVIGCLLLADSNDKGSETSKKIKTEKKQLAQPPKKDLKTKENYFPLAVGNKQTYRLLSNGTDTDAVPSNAITEKYEWRSRKVFKEVDGKEKKWFVYFDKELRKYSVPPESDDSDYIIVLQEPLEVGHSWSATSYTTRSTYKCEIVSVNTEIGVPAGRFYNCIKVAFSMSLDNDPPFATGYLVYAPKVGLVKMVMLVPIRKVKVTKILTRYTVKEK